MDIITKSHFEQFKKQYGCENKADSDAFELFSIYCVVSKYIKTDTISRSMLDDLNIGNGDYPCGKQKITGEENGINCTPEYKYHSQMFNVVVPRNDQDED